MHTSPDVPRQLSAHRVDAVGAHAPSRARALGAAYWALRVGAALCFIGHGAFGFITKAGWVPYFGVVGLPESIAWKLMPLVGALDVLAAMWVLFAPRGVPLVYMSLWAAWTALLRPLAGESAWEAVERAGNYGVPLAMLALTGGPASALDWRTWWARRDAPSPAGRHADRARRILQATVCLLLLGHGTLGILGLNAGQGANYAAAGWSASAPVVAGWFELAMALAVAVRPGVGVLLLVALWKGATESLWILAGDPLWETVERAGSVAAPIALAALLQRTRSR